jgi:hypothetical protein
VNDDILVNIWQDVLVDKEQTPAPGAPAQSGAAEPPCRTATGGPDDTVRVVTDVETLKALADPIRLALLAALMRSGYAELRVMSVKELAAPAADRERSLAASRRPGAGLTRASGRRPG